MVIRLTVLGRFFPTHRIDGNKKNWAFMAVILQNPLCQRGVVSCELGGIGYAQLLFWYYRHGRGSMMDVSSPLIRQWILLKILSARHYGVTVKELAEEMNVSEKTIRRDLEIFQTAGFPLEETVEEFGRKKWKLESGANPPGLCLLWDEAAAIFMGQRFLEPLAGTPFWEAAQRAFKRSAPRSATVPLNIWQSSPRFSIKRRSARAIIPKRPRSSINSCWASKTPGRSSSPISRSGPPSR